MSVLTPTQQQEADRLFALLQAPFLEEARRLADLLASKDNAHLLGKTEFELRDQLHHLGAATLQTALDERKKGGTKVPV